MSDRYGVSCPRCAYPLVTARPTTTGGLRIVPERGVIVSDTHEPGTVAVRCGNCVSWYPILGSRVVIYQDISA